MTWLGLNRACHAWGQANQVEFESSKESFTIIHRHDPFGEAFKLLGGWYDTRLDMTKTIDLLSASVGFKLRTLFKVRSFYSVREMVNMFKAKDIEVRLLNDVVGLSFVSP